MITVYYAPKGKDKPIQAANNKKPVTRRRKMKTVKIVLTALVTGACFGSIPYVLETGAENHWLYSTPPVARCGVSAYQDLHRFRKVVQK